MSDTTIATIRSAAAFGAVVGGDVVSLRSLDLVVAAIRSRVNLSSYVDCNMASSSVSNLAATISLPLHLKENKDHFSCTSKDF